MSDCVWVLQLLNSVFSSLIWLPKPSDAVSTGQLSRGQVVANSESLYNAKCRKTLADAALGFGNRTLKMTHADFSLKTSLKEVDFGETFWGEINLVPRSPQTSQEICVDS